MTNHVEHVEKGNPDSRYPTVTVGLRTSQEIQDAGARAVADWPSPPAEVIQRIARILGPGLRARQTTTPTIRGTGTSIPLGTGAAPNPSPTSTATPDGGQGEDPARPVQSGEITSLPAGPDTDAPRQDSKRIA